MFRTITRIGILAVAVLILGGCGGGGGGVAPPTAGNTGTDRSVASGYVYERTDGRAAATDVPVRRLTLVRERLQQANYRPVVGATVSIPDRDGTVTTDQDGYFEIQDVPEGQVDVTVVPPPESGMAPGMFGVVAGPRPRPGQPPRPPVSVNQNLFVLPPRASVEVGDALQFYAVAMGSDGPHDVTDQVTWRLRSPSGEAPVGELTEGGLFTARRAGRAVVAALAPSQTKAEATIPGPDEVEVPPPGQATPKAYAVVEVLPQRTAIQGKVLTSSDQPVQGAFVFAAGIPDFAVTEYDGSFFFPLVPPNQPIDLSVVYQGTLVATDTATVAAGEVKEVVLRADVTTEPPPAHPMHAVGRIMKLSDSTTWQYGTHVLRGEIVVPGPPPLPEDEEGSRGGADSRPDSPRVLLALQSNTVNLDDYVGRLVEIRGARVDGYPVDGGPPLVNVTGVQMLSQVAATVATERPEHHMQGGPDLHGRPSHGR